MDCFLQVLSPTVSSTLLFLVVILLFVSFLLAGARVAFFSLTGKDVDLLKTRKQLSYKRIVDILENPRISHTSIVIANLLINVAIVLLVNLLLNNALGEEGAQLSTWLVNAIKILVITLLLAVFLGILPRVWAGRHKVWFASTSSMVVQITAFLFNGISRQVDYLNRGVQSLFGAKNAKGQLTQRDEDDILEDANVSEDEKRTLKGVVKFSNTTVKQIMRTRLDVKGIDITAELPDVLKMIQTSSFSRFPIYNGTMDDISGILHIKDLLDYKSKPKDFEWQSLIRPVFFVHEQKLIDDLLNEFREKKSHLAVVVDEFGGTSGIVTMEDVIEEVIGEIRDEFDSNEDLNKRIGEDTYIFEGKTLVEDACDLMGISGSTFDEARGDSDSLGGLVLELAGDFPKVNDEFKINGYILKPVAIDKNRILKILVTVPNEPNETS